MASTRISAPMRGATYQLSRLQIRQDALSSRCSKCLSTPFARSITTSRFSQSSVSPINPSVSSITTSAVEYIPVKPLSEQTVLATIHSFPSLEPLRFEKYPANDLNLPLRSDILHRAVIYEGDMTRLGTASSKNRHEVRGSRRKIRPQKGSGRARLGDKKSPMLRGGGQAFGPKPRDYSTELPKKVYDLAWRTALSHRFRKGDLYIVDNAIELESPSTRLLLDIMDYQRSLQEGKGRNLFITLDERPFLEDALAQLDRGEETLTWEEVDVKNILEQQRIVIERAALHSILREHREILPDPRAQNHPAYHIPPTPNPLANLTGWPQFRAIHLSPSTSRPAAYEDVAETRHAEASSLPEGAQRTSLMISAYSLLAESKQLHFQNTTGMSWAEYNQTPTGNMGTKSQKFPKIQQLAYQQSIQQRLADEASELSRLESEEYERAAKELEIKKLDTTLEATVLAAQVYEHEREALLLQGDEESAGKVYELAAQLRTEVGDVELEILEARLAVKTLDVGIQRSRGNEVGVREAEAEVERLQAEIDEARASREEVEEEIEGGEVFEGQEVLKEGDEKVVDVEGVRKEEKK